MTSYCSAVNIDYLAYLMVASAVFVLIGLRFLEAPYGRYGSSGAGPSLPGKLAWILQETPAFLVPILLARDFDRFSSIPASLLLFLIHYFQRSFIFPIMMRGNTRTPFITFATALAFCVYNGFLQGCSALHHAHVVEPSWFLSNFGAILFFAGMFVNMHSDHILRNLRKPGETGYKIPRGGMFEYVSGANYFGEIIEWLGFWMVAQTIHAGAFAFFTVANIGPRALQHHRWYQGKFGSDYPPERRALIPFIL